MERMVVDWHGGQNVSFHKSEVVVVVLGRAISKLSMLKLVASSHTQRGSKAASAGG